MKRLPNQLLICTLVFLSSVQLAFSQASFNFDLSNRGPEIPSSLFGIFFEEINRGGDGGLYGELIANRSFEDNAWSPDFWSSSGDVSVSITTDNMLNSAQGHALKMEFSGTNGKVTNSGYWGIKITSGQTYHLTFWARSEGGEYQGNLTASLLSSSGTSCGAAVIAGPFSEEWKKYTVAIPAKSNSTSGSFQLRGSSAGTLVVDVVSLFGSTFKNRENGMRTDLAQMLADIHPAFVRFPGGCYVEGMWNGSTNRFEWKKTIGPIEERSGHRNNNWGYQVNDGMGFHEYLQFCEDIDAEALFVVNVGMGHYWCDDYTDIDEYVQEALDAIEYANGDSTTTWGSLRAKNGHPEPFNLRYIEIGNENYNFIMDSNADQSDHYPERYYTFYKAIKAAYPDIKLIGNVESWGTDNPSWRNTYPNEIVDEHYYRSPDWFVNNYNKYDTYSRAKGQVYVGEYAVTQNFGTLGNLNSALGEAVFMQGMENNSDVVVMSSYAPIFCNENAQGWMPDMIRFNCYTSYGTPSYYVQKLFGSNVGRYNVKWEESNNVPQAESHSSTVGVGTWNTSSSFTDLKVTDNTGTTLLEGSSTSSSSWNKNKGNWSVSGGMFQQSDSTVEGATCTYNVLWPSDTLTYRLKATKTAGNEGFLIIFDYQDSNNYSWWNIGGWNNTSHGIQTVVDGVKTTVASSSGSLVSGQTYDIRIEKKGQRVLCYLDGKLIHDTNIIGGYSRGAYVSSALNETKDKLIVKLTNPNPVSLPSTLTFTNGKVTGASMEVLTSGNGTDENSLSTPRKVVPKSRSVTLTDDGSIVYDIPAYSFSVLTLTVADVKEPEEQSVTLPEPVVKYTFESGEPVDDSGNYQGALMNGASIMQLSDGNKVLYTGAIGSQGYMDLGIEMPKAVFSSGKSSDYSISLDLLNRAENQLSNYSWALSIADGTNRYAGIINAGGNSNWYYEVKNSVTQNTHSYAGMTTGDWHNITYVQEGNIGKIYIDGRLYREKTISVHPHDFIENITSACIGCSPYTGDAYMENAYFDNLCFYQTALTAAQVEVISEHTSTLQNDEVEKLQIVNALEELIKEVEPIEKYANNGALSDALDHSRGILSVGAADAIDAEYEALQTVFETYKQGELTKARNGYDANLSFLIQNGLFTKQSEGWEGETMTAIYGQTAEQFSKVFDNYQNLSDMPAGTYKLVVSAFYRNGAISQAYENYNSLGAKANLAQIYISNDDVELYERVKNLYSASSAYTYEPYTYPDNLAGASEALNKELYENEVTMTIENDGDLRIGIRKTEPVAWDWTAFDNFRLYYMSDASAINQIESNRTGENTIYDIAGRRLKRISSSGIYIVNGKKILR